MGFNIQILLVFLMFSVILVSGGCHVQPTEELMEEKIIKSPSIEVSAQTLIDGQVVINNLYLDKPGYVVIHQDADGKPGSVIGNSELLSEEVGNLKVSIDSSKAGTKVFAMLHYDDDNDGVYGFPDEDKPVILEGNVVVKPIEIKSIEETMKKIEEPAVREFILDADDKGFYPSSKITVNEGDKVKLTFNVMDQNVYFGGLDFRAPDAWGDTGKINPGQSTIVEFVATESFNFKSYWPASNRLKATGEVVVIPKG